MFTTVDGRVCFLTIRLAACLWQYMEYLVVRQSSPQITSPCHELLNTEGEMHAEQYYLSTAEGKF